MEEEHLWHIQYVPSCGTGDANDESTRKCDWCSELNQTSLVNNFKPPCTFLSFIVSVAWALLLYYYIMIIIDPKVIRSEKWSSFPQSCILISEFILAHNFFYTGIISKYTLIWKHVTTQNLKCFSIYIEVFKIYLSNFSVMHLNSRIDIWTYVSLITTYKFLTITTV